MLFRLWLIRSHSCAHIWPQHRKTLGAKRRRRCAVVAQPANSGCWNNVKRYFLPFGWRQNDAGRKWYGSAELMANNEKKVLSLSFPNANRIERTLAKTCDFIAFRIFRDCEWVSRSMLATATATSQQVAVAAAAAASRRRNEPWWLCFSFNQK